VRTLCGTRAELLNEAADLLPKAKKPGLFSNGFFL